MTVEELYAALQEDYEEVFDRIGNDKWIAKYLKKFTAQDYVKELREAIQRDDWEQVFKESHSLKGLALNLGLSKLARTSTELCESVRHGAPEGDISDLFTETEKEYRAAIEQIGLLDA